MKRATLPTRLPTVTKRLELTRADVPALAKAAEPVEKPTANAPSMPPTKTAKQKPGLDQTRINELFAKNLEEIRRHFRRRDAGVDPGLNVTTEYVLGYVVAAWTAALEGKNWQPSDQ